MTVGAEVGPIFAQSAGRQGERAVGLPTLMALLLASFSIASSIAFPIAFSVALSVALSVASTTALAAPAPGPTSRAGGEPALGAATSGPNAATTRADVRPLTPPGGRESTEPDVVSGHPRSAPAVESAGPAAVAVALAGPHAPGAERHHRGRAPPHAR